MRIGLFGGTFNPIHRCHLLIAEQTQDHLSLDRVLFIPSGDPPHKPTESLAPAHHRLEMVKLAIATYSHFKLTDLESRSTHKSYTAETLHTLRQQEAGELWFIVGLDAFLDFPTWKDATQLLTAANFVVISRPGSTFTQLSALSLLPSLPSTGLKTLDDGHETRIEIATSSQTSLTLLRLPPCEISASVIRSRVTQGLTVSDWLPAPVQSYIITHRLYSSY